MTKKTHLSKMHHRVMHAMPFSISNKREKHFEIVRCWGDWTLELYARETINSYDLITLLLIAREYVAGRYKKCNNDDDPRARVRVTLDIEKIMHEREIDNCKKNRQTFFKSIERFRFCDLKFTFNSDKRVVSSFFISDVLRDDAFKNVEIDCNEKFLQFCARGIIVNWRRLASYKRDNAAVMIDAYLQSTKEKKGGKYQFRAFINESEIFELLDTRNKKDDFELRRIAKKAFCLCEGAGMPGYKYDKIYKGWRLKNELKNDF